MNYLSKDVVLATLTSFLSYFVMSAIISPLGIVSGSLANHFEIGLTGATAIFSFLTTGVLIGSSISLFANPRFGTRKVILCSCAILLLMLVGLRMTNSPLMLPIAFTTIGASCGLLLATAAIVLTALYKEAHRPSALLATDSFYSFAGFAVTPFAGWVVANSLHWSSAYLLAFLIAILIAGIAIITKFPAELRAPETDRSQRRVWPLSVFLVSAALFVYLVCFIFIYSWTPAYATEEFAASPEAAGVMVSRFFMGLFFGQLVVFALAFRVDVRLLLVVIGVGAMLVSVGLWKSTSAEQLSLSLFALGLIAGGLLKPLIAFGSQVVAHPTSQLIGFYMFCTALGSSVSPALGALIVEKTNIATVLLMVTVGLFLTNGFIIASMIVSRRNFQRVSET